MKRRDFIKLGASASAFAMMPFEVEAMLKSVEEMGCNFGNRKLVLINLNGGNDGLNTIIPLNQYDLYSTLRPTIKVSDIGMNAYIPLDSSVQENQLIGLNPAMTGFKSMYDNGQLRVLQSVGYPKPNKSHFASTDNWMTGNDGNSMDNGSKSGWIGRFMEQHYDKYLSANYPLAIQIGNMKNSLGFHGVEEHGMSLNLTGQDPSGFYSVINGLGGEPPVNISDNSDFGKELAYIVESDRLANIYAESVSGAFNVGANTQTYPDTDLADQLKTVARLIKGGLDTKVYMVRISGFDNHNFQVETAGDISGKHHGLLNTLSDAVEAFQKDIDALGISDDIVGVTYSEFGRKAKENGNLGTDHGEIAPMFVFGKGVEGGISGTNPDLTEAKDENNWQIETIQYDYRQVFTTLLQEFMGAGDQVIDDTFFDHTNDKSFTSSKIDEVLKSSYKIEEECRTNGVILPDEQQGHWNAAPNPFKDQLVLRCDDDVNRVFIEVFTSGGRTVANENLTMQNGSINLELGHLKTGLYLLKISNDGGEVERLKVFKQ